MSEFEFHLEGHRPVGSSPQAKGAKDPERPDSSAVSDEPSTSVGVMYHAPDALRRRLGRWVERSSQPFAVVDLALRFVWVNRAFEALVGYSLAELTRLTLLELTPESGHQPMHEALSRMLASGRSARYEKEYRLKNGSVIPIEVAVDLDRDDEGVPIGFYAFVTDLIERKQGETALRGSEERFRRLYDEAPVGYHEVDREGRIVNINRTECEMIGYARDEVLGRLFYDFVAEESRAEARSVFAEKLCGDRPLGTLERNVVTRDGRQLTVSIEERFKRDRSGQVIGLLSTVQDVTARKRTEAALVASEKRARALFEGIEDAVFVHSPDGRILDANPAASRLLGYTHDELLTMTTSDVDAPDFAAGYKERLRSQLERGHLSCEGRHRTKDGRIVPVDINTSTILFDNQRAVLAVIRDITERKALEETRRKFAEAQLCSARDIEAKNQALTVSEARYRQLTEGSLDAVIVSDFEGRITLFNPAAESIFGYAAAEVLGKPISSLMPAEARAFHDDGLRRYRDTRISRIVGHTVELRGLRKDGEVFPLEMSLNAVELAGELQFVGSIRDQTEPHRMRAMLVQSEKLASIGLLSAGVAHEINNPLAYVANNLAVLERDTKSVLEMVDVYETSKPALETSAPDVLAKIETLADDLDWSYVRENLQSMIARTREGVQRVANIVQNLRGLARTSPPTMEPASIADLFESAIEMIRGRIRRQGIELVVEHGDLPRIVCVPSQISQVILNLLINAVQAIESTGRHEGGRIRFAARRDEEMAVLSVYDNGSGIPHDCLPRLFDPFFTTKPVGEGTGLGLSISHGIVTGHGGRIEVESPPGGETCFRVFLPLKPA